MTEYDDNHLRHTTTEKYDNNGKGGYFRFDDDNKMGYEYILSIPVIHKRVVMSLTQWSRVTHKCVGELTNIVSDYRLSPGRRQAIIWTNGGILLIGILVTNFCEIEIDTFSFKKMHLIMSAKWRPFCLGLNVLIWPPRLGLPIFLVIRDQWKLGPQLCLPYVDNLINLTKGYSRVRNKVIVSDDRKIVAHDF